MTTLSVQASNSGFMSNGVTLTTSPQTVADATIPLVVAAAFSQGVPVLVNGVPYVHPSSAEGQGYNPIPGPPIGGSWDVGDTVNDVNGSRWECTAGGTPGSWVQTNATADKDTFAPLQGPFQIKPLVRDGTLVREGAGGPIYRAAGYNAEFIPNVYAASQTLTGTQIDKYFKKLRPNSLTRLRAFAPPSTSGITWAQQLATLDNVVNAARKYGQRLIFCFTSWSSDATGADAYQPKSAAWVTGQQYLHSVYGANSYEDWVKTVVARYKGDATVPIYDLCNEPQDATGAITTDLKTWFDTAAGWIRAIDSDALVYVGIDLWTSVGGTTANYVTLATNMDLCSWHTYADYGYVQNGDQTIAAAMVTAGKPLIVDEMGSFAKTFYGSTGDTDKSDAGWPAVDFTAQGKLLEGEIASMFGEGIFGCLVYSFMYTDSAGGFTDGLGHYQPPNSGLAHVVIRNTDLIGDNFPYDAVTPYTWIDGRSAYKWAPGADITNIYDRQQVSGIATTAGARPMSGRWNGYGSLLFDGTKTTYYAPWQGSKHLETQWVTFNPTALPSSGAYCYLFGPSLEAGSSDGIAIRINSSGFIEMVHYAAPTTGTVMVTSSNKVRLGEMNILAVVQNQTGHAQQLLLNGVQTKGTSTESPYQFSNVWIGSALDGSNGFVGHIFEAILFKDAAVADNKVGLVYSYLQSKYGAA